MLILGMVIHNLAEQYSLMHIILKHRILVIYIDDKDHKTW